MPESLDDWDDFDLTLSITKKSKPHDSPITKPVVTNVAAAAVPTTTTKVVSKKKSLFDDDDDYDDIL